MFLNYKNFNLVIQWLLLKFPTWIWFGLVNFKVENLIIQELVSVGRHLIYTTTPVHLRAISLYIHMCHFRYSKSNSIKWLMYRICIQLNDQTWKLIKIKTATQLILDKISRDTQSSISKKLQSSSISCNSICRKKLGWAIVQYFTLVYYETIKRITHKLLQLLVKPSQHASYLQSNCQVLERSKH